MGEKIASLSKIKFRGSNFEIEMNLPHSKGMKNDIHIQSDNFRFQCKEDDFYKLAANILLSREILRRIKKIE